MKCNLTFKQRPPANHRWWQWLFAFVAMLMLPTTARADWSYFQDHTTTTHNPTKDEPWIVIKMCFIDVKNNDSYFKEDPKLTIDGESCYLKGIHQEGEKQLDNIRSNDTWYGDKQTIVANGTTYSIRLYDPRKDGGRGYIDVYIVPNQIRLNRHVKIEISGRWCPNRSENSAKVHSWKTEEWVSGSFSEWNSTTITRGDYGKVTSTIEVPKNYGPTTVLLSKDNSNNNFKEDSNNSVTIAAGVTSENRTFNYSSTTYDDENPYMEFYYSREFKHSNTKEKDRNGSLGSTKVFDWIQKSLQGYTAPKELKIEGDMWNKRNILSWTVNSKNKNGTWSILRKNDNVTETVARGLSSDSTTWEDTKPSYDTEYTYTVSFVPKNANASDTYNKMYVSADFKLERKFSITLNSVREDNGKLKLYWTSQKYGKTDSFDFKIYRSLDDNKYDYINKVTGNSESTSYTFVDNSDLKSCTPYYYQVRAEILENKTFSSDIVSKGITSGSKLTSVQATKGDYNGSVKLSWATDVRGGEEVKYEVARREINTTKWSTIYNVSTSAKTCYYEDNTALAGNYYEYRVRAITTCENQDFRQDLFDQGFCRTTGIVSGRVSYGSGTAVSNVKVELAKNGNEQGSQFHSLDAKGMSAAVRLPLSKEEFDENFNKNFTIQMLVNPSSVMNDSLGTKTLMDFGGPLTLALDQTTKGEYTLALYYSDQGTNKWTNLRSNINIHSGEWTSISLNRLGKTFSLTTFDEQGTKHFWEKTINIVDSFPIKTANCGISIGGTYAPNKLYTYNGKIDEIRIFANRTLTEKEIETSYNRTLTGTEDGLFAYWPIDEGIEKQSVAYDYSKTNGVANGNHGTITNCEVSSEVPPTSLLSLYALTDSLGNYTVRGIPFSGSGTTYNVIPQLGVHSFSPIQKNVYVSASSLVHGSVDFTDESSFPVKIDVTYKGTSIPVEGCNIYVDGTICSKNGEVITTKADGVEISVPIGKHFIQIKKEGHVFCHNGRYPEDPNDVGKTVVFDGTLKALTFTDSTLVNFTGRIVGGEKQAAEILGFGKSKNNVGVATFTLTSQNTTGKLNNTENRRNVESATPLIASKAYIEGGGNIVSIQTDPATGEFSAMLPPLTYDYSTIVIATQKDTKIRKTTVTPSRLDLSNPLISNADTLDADNIYEYHTAYTTPLYADPEFTVNQEGAPEGVYGMKDYTVSDGLGDDIFVELYSKDATKKTGYKYNYDYPVFNYLDTYVFKLKAYEKYVNYDGTDPATGNYPEDIVPLEGTTITVSNALSAEQGVIAVGDNKGQISADSLVTNEIVLDENGEYTYTWQAGLPNITAPYARGIQFNYYVGNAAKQWPNNPDNPAENQLLGIVLGSLPSGNDFVTQGPDVVEMILRDPPGTLSNATWVSGTSKTTYKANSGVWSTENTVTATAKLGLQTAIMTGWGVAMITNSTTKYDQELGTTVSTEGESGTSWSRTTTLERAISTSAEPEYVGANGDVFIGTSTNIIFGNSYEVGLHRVKGTNNVELNMEVVPKSSISFGTQFQHSAFYIENTLLPKLEEVRNSYLKTLESQAEVEAYVNDTDEPVYVTSLTSDHELYGTDNDDERWEKTAKPHAEHPSYRMVLPKNDSGMWSDTIVAFNNSIANWKKQLALNEEEKVKAYDGDSKKYLDRNLSFDAGSAVTLTHTNEETNERRTEITTKALVHGLLTMGFTVNCCGFEGSFETNTGKGYHYEGGETKLNTNTFSYTLAETGDDALTVDVFGYKAFSPIFRTRGGQTSAPYEGEVQTAYYKPGTTIMEATMQVEKPQLEVDNLKWSTVAGVPTGGSAYYNLQLRNISETGADVYYKLFMPAESNKKGARLAIDGMPITETGLIMKVPALNTIEKSLQLTQTNQSVLRYDSIAIVLASQTQFDPTSTWGVISDTVWVSAEFVPSSSAVSLGLNKTVMNTDTGDDLTLTFRNFDRKYSGQKAFRVQSYAPGANSWSTLCEYVLDKADLKKGNPNIVLLPEGNDISYEYNMHSLPDGTYRFRMLSVSTYGNKEITRPSDELTIVKDMAKPRSMGMPQPSDGLLGIGKDISIVFNENIVSGSLNTRDNFEVTAVLNGAQLDHTTALSMQDTEFTAQTEADVPLSGKDFAMDMWINVKGEGTIVSHGGGNEKFAIGIDSEQRLRIDIGKNTYTSTEKMPLDEWAYLTISYASGVKKGVLNASVAYGAYTTPLFTNADVALYHGNGKLTIGKRMKGSIHELTLWDEAHSLAQAQAERQKSKLPSTPHLIGYWRMNEGEGKTLTDAARNRHMAMPAATWFVDNEGRSVAMDGSGYIAIPTAHIAPSANDNFAIEMWLRADDKQQGETQIMQLGDIALYNKADGSLQLASASDEWTVYKQGILDNAWHHVALNILRSGNAVVYIDGTRAFSTAAKNLGSVASDSLIIGARRMGDNTTTHFSYDRKLKAAVDEVRMWNATLDATTIAANRSCRLTGKESGLAAYYPFEKRLKNDYGVLVVEPIDSCMSTEGQGLRASYAGKSVSFTQESPALKKKPEEESVLFNFTANDNSIVINLEEDAALIEGCTVNFTVKNVSDLNGNSCEPICWSALVSQNPLSWRTESNTSAQYAAASLSAEQELGATTELTAYVVNKSASAQAWTLKGVPSWLKASETSGNIEAQSEQTITLMVLASCPTGRHATDVYLTTEDGLSAPLAVSVKVNGNVPAWEVDASKYESSMNVVGKLVIEDIPTSDTDDIVAAFIGGECRGVAHPTYNSRYDDYFVLMDIYADGSDKGKDVEFRVYDASQDRILPRIKTTTNVSFDANTLVGSYQSPLLLEALPYVEQILNLTEGWNWTSLNVLPDDLNAKNVWADAADRLDVVKSKRASIMSTDGVWDGNDFLMSLAEMYKVKAFEPTTLSVFGTLPTTEQKTITVRSGWNWIGFNAMQPMSVADAFAALDPVDGDMVKSKQGFAIFDGYEWSGTLTALVPGNGYMYRSMDSKTRSFCYPEATLMAAPAQLNAMRNAEDEATEAPFFEPVDDALYPGNMTVVARVYYDGEPVANAEVGVFVADECRTHEYTDADGIVYLTIPGDRAEALSFKLRHNGETHIAETHLNYQDDGVVGNKREPFAVEFGKLTSINMSTIDGADDGSEWYDIEGRRLPKKPTETGVYIQTKDGKAKKVTIVNREYNR